MRSRAIFILDPNEFRAASYASMLAPFASRSETDVHVVLNFQEIRDISGYECLACIYCVGGLSLRDPEVARTVSELSNIFGQFPVMVLSDLPERQEIVAAMEMELSGFLPTTMPSHVALAAIQFILAGGTYLPYSLGVPRRQPGVSSGSAPAADATRLLRPCVPRAATPEGQDSPLVPLRGDAPDTDPEPLKRRHVEVLAGVSRGQTNKVIARHLNITEATVKLYVRQLMKIFGAENRTQLALNARDHPQVAELIRPETTSRPSSGRMDQPAFRPGLSA